MSVLSSGSTLRPQCSSCCRQLTRAALDGWKLGQTPVRGKKKNAKPKTTIPVKLLKDLPGFGRAGSTVPMPMGIMRNVYYPQRIATYLPQEEAKSVMKSGTELQRDYMFMRDNSSQAGASIKGQALSLLQQPARPTKRFDPVKVDIKMIDGQHAFNLLDQIIPPTITFYRTPIENADLSRSETFGKTTPSEPAATDDSALRSKQPGSSREDIYGSVSAQEIAANLKALLSETESAGRIALEESDIKFFDIAGNEMDENRIKKLGDHHIGLHVRKHDELLRRVVRVQAENTENRPADAATKDTQAGSLAAQKATDALNSGFDAPADVAPIAGDRSTLDPSQAAASVSSDPAAQRTV